VTPREIWHEILINASPTEVFGALTDVTKLAHWWTTDVRGESAIEKKLEFWFSGFRAAVIEVISIEPDQLVHWRVVDGGAEGWIDTEVEFKVFRDQDKTFLHFRHSNWKESARAFPHCSMGWAIFLLSLKEFVETGKGRPHPYDMPVNLWSPPKERLHESVGHRSFDTA
jgi:uncharacterized protein YndB with AHSA1/START domain